MVLCSNSPQAASNTLRTQAYRHIWSQGRGADLPVKNTSVYGKILPKDIYIFLFYRRIFVTPLFKIRIWITITIVSTWGLLLVF